MFKAALGILMVSLIGLCVVAQAETLMGQVLDSEGTVIAGVPIQVVSWTVEPAHQLRFHRQPLVYTDSKGGFELDLDSGTFDIFISYADYIPVAKQISLSKGKEERIQFRLISARSVKFIE